MRSPVWLVIVLAVAGTGVAGRKGADYKAPAGSLGKEVLWASQCEEPAGQGLAFSGQSQSAPDGQPHTRIKDGDAWRPIGEELRKANPFQRDHDQLWAIRTRLKDAATLARFIYFEGRAEAEEKKFIADRVNPELAKIAKDLADAPIRLKTR